MKFFSIIILLLPNFLFAEILDKFSLACICDKTINALQYFDCKQKVSGTQLDILDNQIETQIYSTFDEKIYYLNSASSQELSLIYETEDYISSMTIDPNLEMVFSINYKAYDKKWSYDLKCVSLKKE